MSMINIDELHKKRIEKLNRKNEIYELILKKCHNRIKLVAKLNNDICFCFYIVPNYIYGIPLYNFNECMKYVVTSLVKNGFDVKYTHPNLLYISWLNKSNPKSIENTKINTPTNQKRDSNYRPINSYKPSGNLIYNQYSLNNLENKAKKYLN